TRALINKAAINLDQTGTRSELLPRSHGVVDTPYPYDGQCTVQSLGQLANNLCALVLQRTPTEATGFTGMGHVIDHLPIQGGIGGNNAIDPVFDQGCRDLINFIQTQVRCNFNGERHVLFILGGQLLLTHFEGCEQLIEGITVLQRTQARSVGGRNIDGNIAGMIIDLVHADQIIVLALLYGSVLILADIDANDALVFGFLDLRHQMIDPLVVESHAVDDPLCRNNPEQTGLVIATLGFGGDGTDFYKAKPHGPKCIDALPVFIQPGCQSDRIGKIKPHDSDGAFGQ